jgi:hypothetical protein
MRWKGVLHSRAMFGAVAWAPSRPSLAYAVGDDGSLWRSTDGGTRWIDLSSDSPSSALNQLPRRGIPQRDKLAGAA